ncbi:M48 family metallopeptidase, partial [Dermabacter hominis]|uniref:M48 family metallopeptidase n=1 Tax=Dermabacter hominis TaxID=36740 RepID=UPI003182C579
MTEIESQDPPTLESEHTKPAGKPGLFNGSTRHGLLGDLSLRHPWDIPLFAVGVLITCLLLVAWVGAVVFIIYMAATGKWSSIQPAFEGESADGGLSNPYSPISIGIQLFVAFMLIPWVLWIARALMYAQLRASGVRMSPTQFPEGYRMVAEAAEQFGMRRVPDAYVLSGNGMINAFAAGHGYRRFVCVYSDLFEVGGKVRDPEALRFVIAHEVGHHAAGHTSYFRLLFSNFMMRIPILGKALSRAQEYTADNYGYAHVPEGAPGTMALLSGGKYLNAHVNVHELADRAATEKGLWIHLVNLSVTHPVITWRAHALRDRPKPGRMWLRPKNR